MIVCELNQYLTWGEYMDYTFNIVVCDDDGQFADKATEKVSEIMSSNGYKYTIHECYNGRELVEYCKNNRTDIVLADIDMPYMNGFESVEELQKKQPELSVIFITAHNELAYQAYDYHPFCFVSKTDLGRLNRVLLKLINKINLKKERNNIIRLQFENVIDIEVDKIVYFDTSKNYIVTHRADNTCFSFRGTIKKVYEQLKNDGFVLVQRGYIANCRYIKQLNSKYVILYNDEKIAMTRDVTKSKEARELYGKFVRERL